MVGFGIVARALGRDGCRVEPVGQELPGRHVARWCSGPGLAERPQAPGRMIVEPLGIRVGAEVVVERPVLHHQKDHVLDGVEIVAGGTDRRGAADRRAAPACLQQPAQAQGQAAAQHAPPAEGGPVGELVTFHRLRSPRAYVRPADPGLGTHGQRSPPVWCTVPRTAAPADRSDVRQIAPVDEMEQAHMLALASMSWIVPGTARPTWR